MIVLQFVYAEENYFNAIEVIAEWQKYRRKSYFTSPMENGQLLHD